ncbi:hypothetical protein [Bradyrhizobium sp.]
MTRPLEIVVWEPFPPGEDPVRFQRRMATVRIKPDGSIKVLDRMRKTITRVRPLQSGESVWRLIERAAARMARGDEIDAIGAATYRPSDDPLGYDTSDPDYLRWMALDALTGRHQAAVDAEADRAAAALGRPPIAGTRRRLLRRWISRRWWRVRFWI